MTRVYALLAVAFVAALVGGAWFMTRGGAGGDKFAQCRSSQIAGGTDTIGGAFELVNAKGETVTDKDVITEPSIVYFGYTFCPDVCPMDSARNADAVDVLAERGISVTPVFISIDPDRDTPEAVGDFAENLHEKMIGLTGSLDQVKAASKAYKTYFKKNEGDEDYYLVDHSTFSYLVLPEDGFVEFFRRDETAEQMADKTACFIEKI
ncbi:MULTISPECIES: SCO family protein [unclassified Leisingera]|uniref:SCO family protein n=1 Tax=unclassified Leisingera TaxID=2614906 RepID=UPI001012A8AB|nr:MULTISPECIES: SCO family protein [unclassified Leisingera]MBQ4823210.1 SCO family protein [Leisingera sp. HS039]MCF6429559.1 SCO family protein [Leisingera sp. MMG026]QAX31500.1 SCO family protein [Leisingera sp. NJS204]QBR38051.1 SCO family protein [Leisingera sp. NJS201]